VEDQLIVSLGAAVVACLVDVCRGQRGYSCLAGFGVHRQPAQLDDSRGPELRRLRIFQLRRECHVLQHIKQTTEVRVRFGRRVAKAAIAARVVLERAIERRTDGAVDIVYHVADVDELLRWVLGWGEQAEVLAPARVRARVCELLEAIGRRYAP